MAGTRMVKHAPPLGGVEAVTVPPITWQNRETSASPRPVPPYSRPIVALTGGHLSGFEALLRWEHPTRGLIAPDQFIPVAEETGLKVPSVSPSM